MARRRLLLAASTYFALVFAAGFLLGTFRVLWLEPVLGTRWAELGEIPVMIAACWFAAGWTVRRFAVPPHPLPRLVVGGLALLLLLAAEVGVLVFVRGSSPAADVAGRDPVSGTAYLLSLIVFALLPLFVARRSEDEAVEAAWKEEAERRYSELKSGAVEATPSEQVFTEARERFR